MTSNIFYQSVSINFDKQMFAVPVIITKQLLTKQFQWTLTVAESEAPFKAVLENRSETRGGAHRRRREDPYKIFLPPGKMFWT